jgi:hypothetical protein
MNPRGFSFPLKTGRVAGTKSTAGLCHRSSTIQAGLIPGSDIAGDSGVSPITATARTGFNLIAESSDTHSKSAQFTGDAYAAEFFSIKPSMRATAISEMEVTHLSSFPNLGLKGTA